MVQCALCIQLRKLMCVCDCMCTIVCLKVFELCFSAGVNLHVLYVRCACLPMRARLHMFMCVYVCVCVRACSWKYRWCLNLCVRVHGI
jgi:hypothetical protein